LKNLISLSYFLVLSAFIFILDVSDIILDVSVIFEVSDILVIVVSVVLTEVESVDVVDDPELLQATITVARERIAKIFFMTSCFKDCIIRAKVIFFAKMPNF